jgi:hypothetical protein
LIPSVNQGRQLKMRRVVTGIAGVALACALANGCSADGRPAPLGVEQAPVLGSMNPVSGPCSPEGSSRACHVAITNPGEGSHCAEGVQLCSGGVWSPCGGGPSESGDAGPARQEPAQTQALTIPSSRFINQTPDSAPRVTAAAQSRITQVRALFASAESRLTAASAHAHGANVRLPASASGAVVVEDQGSHVAVSFTLRGATSHAAAATGSGLTLYSGGVGGADVIRGMTSDGVEDFAVFDQRPQNEELSYDVDVSEVAGLRTVSNTLEFLDTSGTPRLRIAPPSIVDARGVWVAARLSVDGCAADTDPSAPWGRPVVAPGAASCTVRIAWAHPGLTYPVLVDPAWTLTGSMTVAREAASASLLGTAKVLVAGGYSGSTYYGSAELYDPASGTWAATGSMTGVRASHMSASYGSGTGLVLVAGGTDGTSALATAEIYNATTGTFATTGSLSVGRYGARATVLSTTANVVVTGGITASGPTSSVEYFNAGTGTFMTVGSMAQARAYHTATELSPGTVLVTGGTPDGTTFLQSAETYAESSQTFTTLSATMTTARAHHAATPMGDGRVLITGSWSPASQTSSTSTEIYDPTTGQFGATTSMNVARGEHVARLLPASKILVAGGFSGKGSTASAEIYDVNTKAFNAISSMNSARALHGGIVLASGKTLVMGGEDGNGVTLSSAELLGVPRGAACTGNADCISGVCNDGICCAGACSGACTTCTPNTGACSPVIAAQDPDTCTGTNWCNALAQCAPVPDPCATDPCDPYCKSVTSDAGEGGITSTPGGGSYSATVGLGGTPAGFASKELCNPCTGPFPNTCGAFTHYNKFDACESDYHCNTATGACVENGAAWTWPTSVCAGVDLTVEASCSTGSSYMFPVCNRGNTAVPSGKTLAFYIVNGNQWSVNPNTCPALSTSCSYTLTSPLLPGTCQPVTTCAWAGNSVAYVNSNNAITECAAPTGPGCGNNWADIKSGATTCSTVSSYTPTQVTQQYVATCASGSHVHWNFLTYSSVVATNASGNSDVLFEAQTAPVTGGVIGTFTSYVTLADAIKTNPAVCQSPCEVDLFAKLGGVPTATNEVLNLRITVSPTPDSQASGTLQNYALTYDCVPSE